jgi:WD40 repeat protein
MNPRRNLIKRCGSLLSVLLLLAGVAKAQDVASFDSIPREQLLATSIDTTSPTERVTIRSYLARKYPQTTEGIFSKAWIEDYEGRSEEAIKLYRQCIAQEPNMLVAYFNLAALLKGKEIIEPYAAILSKDPSFRNYDAIYFTYYTYRNDLNDTPAADAFLERWEKQLPGLYLFDFIRGANAARFDKDYQKAEQYYLKAIERGTNNFRVYRTLTDLRIDYLSDSQTDVNKRFGYLMLVVEYIRNNPTSSEAKLYLGDRLYEIFNSYREAFDIDSAAFRTNPSAEAAIQAFNAAKRYSMDDAERFLLDANEKLPNNHLILSRLGYLYSNQLNDRVRAEEYHKQAIKFSYTKRDEISNSIQLAVNVYEELTFEFDRAEAIYRSYLDVPSQRNSMLTRLFYNRRNAQDFRAALKYLNEDEELLRGQKTINETWFLDRHKELDLYLSAEERAASYYRDNPYLKVWQSRYPDDSPGRLLFDPNSAQIPASEKQKLSQMAELMLEKGAEKYVFSVDGYTERSETDSDTLSQRRAEAVAHYLSQQHNVPLTRLRVSGRGVSPGINSNKRFVEVFPLGNTSNPSILPTAALNTEKHLAVSPAGDLIATGDRPIQIWDSKNYVKLRDLGRGGQSRSFSPDGRYLATATSYKEIGGQLTAALLVYDVRSGLVVAQVPWSYEVSWLDWSPDGSRIVFTTADYNKIVLYDFRNRKLVRSTVSPGSNMNGGDRITWTKDGKYIVAARAQVDVVHVYDANSLSLVRTLDGVNWGFAVSNTSDSKYLVCADNDGMLKVWDTATFTLRKMPLPVAVNMIAVHPEKPIIALNDFRGLEHNRVILVDLVKMEVTAQHDVGLDTDVEIGFSAKGDKLFAAKKDRIEILDGLTLNLISSYSGDAFSPRGGTSDQERNYYLSYDEQNVNVWNIATGRKVHSWNLNVQNLAPLPGEASQFLGLVQDEATQTTSVRIFDTATFQQSELLKLDFKVEAWDVNGDTIAFAGARYMPVDFGSEDAIIETYDRKGPSKKWRTQVKVLTDYLRYGKLNASGVESFDINSAGTEAVITTYWQDGNGHANQFSKEARVISLADGKVLYSFHNDNEVRQVAFNRNNSDQIQVRTRSRAIVYDRRTWKQVSSGYDLRAFEHEIKLKGGESELRWGDDYLRLADIKSGQSKQIVFGENLRNVEVFEKQNLFVTIGNSNEISFFDLTRLEKVLSIISKKNNEWIAYAPSGEFASSINGTNKVFWLVGDQTLDFAALRSTFERPNILAERLERLGRLETNPAAKSPTIDAELFVVPYAITVLSAKQLETSDTTYKLQVKVQKSKPDLPDPVLEYSQQLRPVEEEQQARAGLAFGRDVIEREFKLADGPNVIQVSILYKNATLATQTVLVTKKVGTGTTAATNDLWFLGVGVSHYQNTAFNLNYADKDVQLVSDVLKKQEGKLYRKVHTELLLNQDANSTNIKAGMYEFLKKASDQDVVVIYIAGHGSQDSDQALYFMPYESDLAKPYTGIDLLDFQKFLSRRPANQKAIVCMDICHAGSYGVKEQLARGGLTVEEAVKQLAEGTGLVVLASSTGRESSLESPEYAGGHGAFTAALIEALEGNGDLDKDGYISMAEVQNYVSRRVPDITKGQQHPTVPLVQQLRDFPFVASLGGR